MEVICVNDLFSEEQKKDIPNRPVKDEIYTIRESATLPNGQHAVWLVELENPELPHPSGLGTFEPSFNVKRFTDLNGNPLTWEKVRQPKQREYVYVGVERKAEKKEKIKKYYVH